MNAFLMFLVFICSVILYGSGLPYGNLFTKYKARDDYYEDFYLRKIPKLKVSPNKIKEFLFNHLSWFPIENLNNERTLTHMKGHGRRRDIWDMAVQDVHNADPKICNLTFKEKVKEFGHKHHISNWTDIKNDTSKSVHKVKDIIQHTHLKDMLKNATHPLRYKGSKHGNTTDECEHHPDHPFCICHNRTHPKSSHVEKLKSTTYLPMPVLPHYEAAPCSASYGQPTLQQQCSPVVQTPAAYPMLPCQPLLMTSTPQSTQMDFTCPPNLEIQQPPIQSTNYPLELPKSQGYPLPNTVIPGIPGIPGMPGIPGLPGIPGMPNLPNPPNLPNSPDIPDYSLPYDPSKPNNNNKYVTHSQPNGGKTSKLPNGHKQTEVPSKLPFLSRISYIRRYRNSGNSIRNLKKKRNRNRRISLIDEKNNPSLTNALENTAGETESDLAGKTSSLWHCVLGSPRIPSTRDIKFYLYTRRNIIQPELMQVNFALINSKIQTSPKHVDIDCVDILPEEIENFQRISDKNREIIKSNFLNIKAPTKILIHGYTGSYKDSRMSKIKDAYLSNGRYNVIQVDWEMLAAPPCYIRVTHHSKFVGETIAQFLNGLYLAGLNMSLVHLVGFSLGAQVAGFTGNNATVVPVCRITGLDPALPLFLHTQPSGHLDRLDAKFVDVIHTCGGILAMLDPLGHVDFYPNGGTRQPGCEFSNLKCSHSRAPQYFAESVGSQKKFKGQLCFTWEEYVSGDCNNSTNTSYMGEPCSRRSADGKYYLLTKSKEPFAL